MPTSEVHAFIRSTFRSVWALELVCLLRHDRERIFTHEEMVAGLRGSDLVVTQSVDSLSAAGLVAAAPGGAARFAPASPELDRMVERSIALYARSPDAVRRTIVLGASSGIAAFADAFRLRKD